MTDDDAFLSRIQGFQYLLRQSSDVIAFELLCSFCN